MDRLTVCEKCGRHMKTTEATCPFCSRVARPRSAAVGLAGAVMVTVGVAGCIVSAYGPAPDLGGYGGGTATDAGNYEGGAIALYASPALGDAG
jgi:hypothetical protein